MSKLCAICQRPMHLTRDSDRVMKWWTHYSWWANFTHTAVLRDDR